ncbi:D-alanyl-D-alanine carboxypeptidase/D-alanyl-D-alanine endopeptidase [Sphingobacterium sp. Mn56C]|uniref:D-alanyl-D-alanine carboxypeptidase/D-alanyl-D-alanine endopeptidase n=1 Tax=Sphingobacterium sp. Mn56C TaxID=3395261 RepID=UPI003BC32018
MNKKALFFLFLYSLFISFSFGQQTAQNIDKSFRDLLAKPSLKNGIAALYVNDSKTGDLVYERNSELGLPTASTLKVITSITALDLLGQDFTYKTRLYYTGTIDSLGILQGNIVIQGAGDPTLGSDRFKDTKAEVVLDKWLQALKKEGISAINGNIIADDRLYAGHDVPGGWLWDDIGNYYGAGISGLNWRENKTGVNFTPGAVHKTATLKGTTTDISYLHIINAVKTGAKGSGDNVLAYTAPYSEKIYLKGSYGLDLNKTIEIAIPDPAYNLAFEFTNYLNTRGIPTDSLPTTGKRLEEQQLDFPVKTKELYVHTSARLAEIIYWFNQKSVNLYGEALLRSIGNISAGKLTTAEGADLLKKYWQQKLQINPAELNIKDGSGLSPQNNVTAKAMNSIMQYAVNRPYYKMFLETLPTYNQMKMKSGTIGGTLGYSGYHTAKDGKQYTFTILVYNYAGTAAAMRQNMFVVLDNLK